MRIRPVALAVVTAAALAGLAGPAAPWSAAAPNPFDAALDASPSETAVPATVVVTGSCPATNVDSVESDVVYQYPSSATLSFPAAGVESQDVALDPGGEFRESFGLPGTLVPGQYTVTLSCIEDESRTDDSVTVLPPPEPLGPATLSLDRFAGEVGDTVSATGTCPSEDSVELFFADVAVGNAPVDSSTDAFGLARGHHQLWGDRSVRGDPAT
jgi:hypothetical protein